MTGFEPRTSGIGSNCSTNWATTSAKCSLLFACSGWKKCFHLCDILFPILAFANWNVDQRTLTLGEVSRYGWPPVYFVSIQLLCLCLISNSFTYMFGQIQISRTGDQPCSDTFPAYGECSLCWHSVLSTLERWLWQKRWYRCQQQNIQISVLQTGLC